MLARVLAALFLVVLVLPTLAQEEEEVKVFDYNGDGVGDTIHLYKEYNNPVGLDFTDGKTHKKYDFWLERSKSSFIELLPIPNELLGEEYAPLLDSIEHMLIYKAWFIPSSEPALEWLLKAYSSPVRSSEHFEKLIKVEPTWLEGDPKPGIIAKRVKRESYPLHAYYWRDTAYTQGWLIYFGHNHLTHGDKPNDWLVSDKYFAAHNKMAVYATSHGLFLRKPGMYAWLFHSDSYLTGGPEKLRWASIKSGLTFKNYVFLHHISTPTNENRFFMIDTKSGAIGELKISPDLDWNSGDCYKFYIEQEKLVLEPKTDDNCEWEDNIPNTIEFDIPGLINELEGW